MARAIGRSGAMAKTTTKLNPIILDSVQRYGRALLESGIPIQDIIVFGSQVKGTAHADSDIDVAVVSSQFTGYRFDDAILLTRLRGEMYQIEPHPMHPDDLNNPWSTFSHEVKTHGVSILPLLQKPSKNTTKPNKA